MADGEVIERLIVQFEGDLTKLEKTIKNAEERSQKGVKAIEGHWTSLEKFMGSTNVSKALDDVFSEGRAGIMRAGGEGLGVFGAGLGKLGPAGLAAAAGVGAFALSVEQAKKAMEWAEELEVVAKKLGVTTTAIQEMDFVAAGSGVSSEIMREGLQKVSQAIGLYQSNVKDARVKSIFEALGISKDDARSWQTPVEGLEAIADKIHALKSTTEQLALAQKLKVPPEMVPLLQMGGDKIREMRGEAESAGAVMDHSMVSKAAEMAAKLKETNLIISVQLNAAFVELAPVVLKIVTMMASMARFAADTAQSIAAVRLDGTMDFSKFSENHLLRQATDTQKEMGRIKAEIDARDREHPGSSSWTKDGLARNQGKDGARYNMLSRMNADIAAAYKTKIEDDNQYNAEAGGGRAGALAPETGKHARAAHDTTDRDTSAAAMAVDEAEKAEAEAHKALAVNVEARAKAEREAVDTEAKKARERLDVQINTLLKDKSIDGAKSDQLKSELERAKALVTQTAEEKKALIDREAADTLAKQSLDLANQRVRGQIEALQLQADAATRGTQRRDIELRILALQDQIETATLNELIAAKGTSDAARQLAQLKLEQLNASRGARMGKVAGDNKDESPLDAYSKSLAQSQAGGAQSVEVAGLKSLNQGLDDAIMKGGKLRDVVGNALRAIEQQLVQLAIEKYLTIPLANALNLTPGGGANGGGLSLVADAAKAAAFLGFANGTDDAPGGMALVGERGPELVNLPKGSQVIPNNTLAGLAGMNATGGGGVNNLALTVHVDAKDAVLTDTVRGWVSAGVTHAIATAVPLAVSSSRRVTANDAAQRSRQAVR